MNGKLTTHVLDLVTGRPAAGMHIELADGAGILRRLFTNSDGRTDEPVLGPRDLVAGTYELRFHVGEYFQNAGGFLDVVPVRFRLADPTESVHVPLLCTPWSYSTYRGS